MFRRCVTFLVIAGFLASQLAAIPHAHGVASAKEQQKHDATPHFHYEWFGHAGHDHGHSHPGQRHGLGQEAPSSDNSDGQPLGIGLSGAAHDSDAVFVPRQAVFAASSKDRVVAAWQLAALVALHDFLGDHKWIPNPSPRWHPPDQILDASDTYLTLRNLRL